MSLMDSFTELNPQGDWSVQLRPFRHVRARRVFREESYCRLEEEFSALLTGGPDKGPEFRQNQPGYDALVLGVREQLASRFRPLFERLWIDFLAGLLDLKALPQVDGALHHIPRNSRSGWVHNDFCSAWFDERLTGEIVFPERESCDYFTGTPQKASARPKEFVRAATMIFYLNNPEWRKGYGGETGLYPASRANLGEEYAVAPVNNSLLLFECSPHSYHRLLANPGCVRNSIILWLHCSVEDAQSRWGRAVKRRKPQ